MDRFRVSAALGLCALSLLCPTESLAIPFTATDPVNNPLLVQINVASGGPFGGGPLSAQQLVGNWVWTITVTETNNPSGTPDVLGVAATVTHNVKPPGPDHINDADKGLPLALNFSVTAGNPSAVAGNLIASLGHPSIRAPEHLNQARVTSLIPVIDLGAISPMNPMPKNDILRWNFTIAADHTIVKTSEPSVWLLLAPGVMSLLYRTVRTKR